MPAFSRQRNILSRSLKARVLVLTLLAFIAVAVPAGISFAWIIDSTIARLGTLFAEKQILYDRYRGMEALTREVALAKTLSRSPAILDWASDENDAGTRGRAISELEHYRQTFADHSYFFVINKSGNYYFNNRDGAYTGKQKRYTLSSDNPDDAWYYKTVAEGPGCHLNVNNDRELGVTKVWINCVVARNGQVEGILGTGIDLTTFLRNVVQSDQPGVESMFVDRSGAVQANRDESLIDFHSLTKTAGSRKTFFQMLDMPADRTMLAGMMKTVAAGQDGAEARFMHVNGKKLLVGVGYLDKLGWYNVTVMDADKIIDRSVFLPIAFLLALVMLAATALITWLFKRSVLDRLARAERSVRQIEAGDFTAMAHDDGASDEIGRLTRTLNRMARVVGTDRALLEATVRERTAELERIAYLDPLTGVLNRRGFVEAFAQCPTTGKEKRAGLLLLDIDNFKAINDTYGHMTGDDVITQVSRMLLHSTRDGDLCARWGGDEFVIILGDCDVPALLATGGAIVDALHSKALDIPGTGHLSAHISVGAHLVGASETLVQAIAHADAALYAAKRQGRNRMVVYDASLDCDTSEVGQVA